MKHYAGIVALVLILGTSAGCKKDSSDPVAPPVTPGTVNETEPNDQTPQALGALGSLDFTVIGGASSATDVDRYSVSIAAGTNLHADITWAGGGDVGVGIMNTSGIMLTFRNTGASPRGCTIANLPAGTYTIYVNANGNTGFPQAYSLKVGPR